MSPAGNMLLKWSGFLGTCLVCTNILYTDKEKLTDRFFPNDPTWNDWNQARSRSLPRPQQVVIRIHLKGLGFDFKVRLIIWEDLV